MGVNGTTYGATAAPRKNPHAQGVPEILEQSVHTSYLSCGRRAASKSLRRPKAADVLRKPLTNT